MATSHPQVSTSVSAIRASPGRELVVEVERPSASAASASGSGSQPGGAEVLQLRVTPDAGSDGGGRMGVQLTSNTYIKHTYAQGPGEVLAMTSSEFNRWVRECVCVRVCGGGGKLVH